MSSHRHTRTRGSRDPPGAGGAAGSHRTTNHTTRHTAHAPKYPHNRSAQMEMPQADKHTMADTLNRLGVDARGIWHGASLPMAGLASSTPAATADRQFAVLAVLAV